MEHNLEGSMRGPGDQECKRERGEKIGNDSEVLTWLTGGNGADRKKEMEEESTLG